MSLCIPYYIFYSDTSKITDYKISDLSTFSSAIISFWALVINLIIVFFAYKAYKLLTVKESFYSKQLETVIKLIDEISKTKIEIEQNLYTSSIDSQFHFFTLNNLEYFKKVDKILIKKETISELLPFLKFEDNPFLPITIAKKIKELNKIKSQPSWIGNIKFDKFLKLDNKDIYSNYEEGIYLEILVSPLEFQLRSKEIEIEIIRWLEKYDIKELNI